MEQLEELKAHLMETSEEFRTLAAQHAELKQKLQRACVGDLDGVIREQAQLLADVELAAEFPDAAVADSEASRCLLTAVVQAPRPPPPAQARPEAPRPTPPQQQAPQHPAPAPQANQRGTVPAPPPQQRQEARPQPPALAPSPLDPSANHSTRAAPRPLPPYVARMHKLKLVVTPVRPAGPERKIGSMTDVFTTLDVLKLSHDVELQLFNVGDRSMNDTVERNVKRLEVRLRSTELRVIEQDDAVLVLLKKR